MENTYQLEAWSDQEAWEKEFKKNGNCHTEYHLETCARTETPYHYAQQVWYVSMPNERYTLVPILH
jgi:hypothetical protein